MHTLYSVIQIRYLCLFSYGDVFFVLSVFVLCLVYPMLPVLYHTFTSLFVFVLCLVYPMLPVSLDCPFFRCSLTFILWETCGRKLFVFMLCFLLIFLIYLINKMKFNWKMIGTDTKSIPLTNIHDHQLSWLGTGTSMKSGGVKLVLLD